MLLNTLKAVAVLAGTVLALAGLSAGTTASADDQKDAKDRPALSGVWVKKAGELKIDFSDKDVLKIFPHGENAVIVILCKYTAEKDGLVKAKIAEFEGKAEAKEKLQKLVPVGRAFSFKWKAKDDTATLDDLKGDDVELLKSHLEGDYEPKK